MRDLTHDEARLRLQLSLDGLLADRESEALAAHLQGCIECRAEALSNHSMLDLWQQREIVAPPSHLAALVMANILAARPLPSRTPLLAPLLAASGGVLLVMAWFFGGLTASASGLLEGLLNAATAFFADPLALWNVGLEWPGASLPIAMEALLTAGLGLLLMAVAGVLALPSTWHQRAATEAV